MSNTEDLAVIARIRRAMPRNADVMHVCAIAEQFLTGRMVVPPPTVNITFDKKAYQRDYMRRRRAESKA